ncbi:uncharacterized protein LOC135633112 isoform X1 [Musa acuminata AAA Group]|uniref:uncharacterized protein LOC135633112 isoform X1 n=1 Tax=Musa acuminata AAA Group TaxID=214697 RepID=UPI0031D4E835
MGTGREEVGGATGALQGEAITSVITIVWRMLPSPSLEAKDAEELRGVDEVRLSCVGLESYEERCHRGEKLDEVSRTVVTYPSIILHCYNENEMFQVDIEKMRSELRAQLEATKYDIINIMYQTVVTHS